MRKYHIISRIAIYMLALVLISFGIFHFKYPRELFVYVPPSLPGGITWVYVMGTSLILVGLSFLTNQFVKITGYIFFVLLVVFILWVHLPNYLHSGDAEMRHQALINLLKDTAIAGFVLHVAAGAHHQHIHLEESD